MVIDVTDELDAARKRGDKIMFEGAQVHYLMMTTVLTHT